MDKRLAQRLVRLSESATLKMARIARQLKEEGKDIISLSIGEPDFDTPDHVKEAGIAAINNNITHYPPVAGFNDLRLAIANKYIHEFDLQISMDQVVVSNGAKQSLCNVILSIIDHGDEVVLPAPYWVSYPEMIKLAGGTIKEIKTSLDTNFKITPQQLEDAITDKTRMFLFSTPSNPSGGVYCQEELEALADVFRKHPNIIIVSDEIYEYINFGGNKCTFLNFTDMADRIVAINGVSKGFAMTGWRIGYMVGPKWIADACNKLQGQLTSGPGTISQMAALEAMSKSKESVYEMRDAFQYRRDLVYHELKKIPQIKTNLPDGAFYFMLDITYFLNKKYQDTTIQTSGDLAMFLLEQAQVSVVGGDAFGAPGYIRISYATSEENLLEAIDRMRKALLLLN